MIADTREAAMIPLDRVLNERLDWYIRLRWIAGGAILVGSLTGLPMLDFAPVFLPLAIVGLAVLAYNLGLFLLRERISATPTSLRRAVHLQIGLDWGALSAAIYLTGGINSPASLAFVFHLIIASILLSRSSCYRLAAAAGGLMGLLTLLTVGGLIWPAGPGTSVEIRAGAEALQIWVALTIFFFVTTYLATSITARLRQKEAALSESESSLDRAYHEMKSLYELGKLVNSTLDANQVLSLIAQHAARLLEAKASFIRLFDRSGKRLYIGGSFGLSQEYIDKGPVEVEKSLVDLEALRGGAIQVLEVGEDPRFQYREEARREGLRSMLSCPMVAQNRTLGVIRVYTGEPHTFSEQEQNLLMNLANLGAVAIQNARSFGDLQTLDEERMWFARMTHHQLRAPLAAVQSSVTALPFAGTLNATQQDLVSRAMRRIQDAFEMIRDLLDLAAAQRMEDPESLPPVRLEEPLRRVLDEMQERARLKGLNLVAELRLQECEVRAEPADIERVFSNLLDNAVKYTHRGTVAIRAKSSSGWLEAIVEDSGIGIGKDELIKVFSGFYRSEAAKATGEVGTGLGLSIVHRIVTRLGGTITVESAPGKGTRFTVRIPTAGVPRETGAEVTRAG